MRLRIQLSSTTIKALHSRLQQDEASFAQWGSLSYTWSLLRLAAKLGMFATTGRTHGEPAKLFHRRALDIVRHFILGLICSRMRHDMVRTFEALRLSMGRGLGPARSARPG